MPQTQTDTCYKLIEENAQTRLEMALCRSEEEILDAVQAWRECGCPHFLAASRLTVYYQTNDATIPVMTF